MPVPPCTEGIVPACSPAHTAEHAVPAAAYAAADPARSNP
jgi:hypothetical protein